MYSDKWELLSLSQQQLLFDPNQSFFFLAKLQLFNFQSCFPFLRPIVGVLLLIFLNYYLENYPFEPQQNFGHCGLLRQHSLWKCQQSNNPQHSFRESSLKCHRSLIIAKAADKSIASSNSWTQEPFLNFISTGIKVVILLSQHSKVMLPKTISAIRINIGSSVLG